MAKRLSKSRRAAAFNHVLVHDRALRADDSWKLQQGAVKSSLARNASAFTNLRAPKIPSLEGGGKLKDRTKERRGDKPTNRLPFDYKSLPGYWPA
jgi:hypothetical protein